MITKWSVEHFENKHSSILRAWYGDPKYIWKNYRGKYVTNLINNKISGSNIYLKINNKIFGDPARGVRKIFIIEYFNINNKKKIVRVFENNLLKINDLNSKFKSNNNIISFKKKTAKNLFNELNKNFNNKVNIYKLNNNFMKNQESTINQKKKIIDAQNKKLDKLNKSNFVNKRIIKYNREELKLRNNVIFTLKIIFISIIAIIVGFLIRKHYFN